MSFSRSFCENVLHLSGAMVSLSLRICYVLKDVSGIFQPGFISFGWERKNVWLRLKNRSTEIEKTFGWELFIVLCPERKLKDTPSILHYVINYITTDYPITWKMKGLFAKLLGRCGRWRISDRHTNYKFVRQFANIKQNRYLCPQTGQALCL